MTPPRARNLPREFPTSPRVAGLLLVAVVALAWANTWHAPFVFDDHASIVDNPTIRQLASLSWLNPPHAAGETVGGRPVLNFSFALNYAVSGLEVWSYHALNALIHAAAAFTLWSVLRRLPGCGAGVAFATALLWALHPLQTAAVTYVVQRAESLAALFTLLTLYGFLRYASDGSRPVRWAAFSALACLAGIGTKETAGVAPLLALLVGRTFFASGWREAWQRHGRLYAALFSSWVVLGLLVWLNRGRGGSAGWGAAVDPLTYALTQAWAVVHYLRLVVWPAPLTFDYGMAVVEEASSVLVPAAVVLALVAVTLLAWQRRLAVGAAGLAFFLLLAPSSSIVPVATQTIAEHRLYLPLAVPLVLICAAAGRLFARLRLPSLVPVLVVAGVATALGVATFARNDVYRSARALWADTVAARDGNPRAHHNLGLALLAEGRRDEARQQFQRAIALQPTHAFAHFQLGLLAPSLPESERHFSAALAADPHYLDARVNLAQALASQGRLAEAVAQYRTALAEQPAADIRAGLGGLLLQLGRPAEAAPLLQQALAEAPELPEAHYHWARLRERAGDGVGAEDALRTALRLRPGYGVAAMALGNLLARQSRFAEAVEAFRASLAAEPANHQARNNLANCFLALERFPEAIAEYEKILQARPADDAVRRNLELARSLQSQRGRR